MKLNIRAEKLLRIERRLMEAEYLIDSTNTHVRRKRCGDVRRKALVRYSNALNAIRSAIQLVRFEQGARHPTLFAGTSGRVNAKVDRHQKQKSWGSNKPHRWAKDCEGEPDVEAERSGAKGALVFR